MASQRRNPALGSRSRGSPLGAPPGLLARRWLISVMTWSHPGGGFAVNVFLRDGDQVYRTWHTDGRGTEQLSHSFALIDLLPYGRQEEWQDSPDGWPQSPTYSRWAGSQDIARAYGTAQPEGAR